MNRTIIENKDELNRKISETNEQVPCHPPPPVPISTKPVHDKHLCRVKGLGISLTSKRDLAFQARAFLTMPLNLASRHLRPFSGA